MTMQNAQTAMVKPSPKPAPKQSGKPKRLPAPSDDDYIAKLFARTVTGTYKQDVALLLEGQKGSGKSHASVRIAYNTARRIAEILDDDWHEWPRYFSIENVAVIDPNRAFEIMGSAKPHNVMIYDDIGVGWNSRAFASKENRDKNDIFQISRINETVQIMSMPHQMLLDKVPRMLCNYKAEMDRAFFQSGFTTLRFFKAKTVYRMKNQQVTPHLVTADGEKVVRHVIYKPPEFLSRQYDAIRQETTTRIINDRVRAIESGEAGEVLKEEVAARPKMTKRAREMYERAAKVLPEYEKLRLTGMAHMEALREIHLSPSTWREWKDRGVQEQYGLGGML